MKATLEVFDRTDDIEDVVKTGVCHVDDEGMVSSGENALDGDICEVYAVASADNFNDSGELKVGSLAIVDSIDFGTITDPIYPQILAVRGLPVAFTTAPSISARGGYRCKSLLDL